MWIKASLASSLVVVALGSASAQENLVTVDLSHLHAQMATNLDIEADEVPMALQLPSPMAADVCGVPEGSVAGSCSATDMMWATHYALQEINGDPFSRADRDDPDRPDPDNLLDAPSAFTNTPAHHGP